MAEVEPVPWWAAAWSRSATTWVWLIAAAALVLAIALVVWSSRTEGLAIAVTFEQGHGVKPGDGVRYRGIEVGQVVDVRLLPEKQQVVVGVLLEPHAEQLAREGSVFWIERPQVSLSRVQGLETVVGAKYLGVIPGPEDAPRSLRFEGVESPPSLREQQPVEITIRFQQGSGLTVGDPVRYRGITVGEVTQVALSESLDSVVVQARLLEQARQLARGGSQFWIERPKVSLTGVRGLETLVAGRYLAVLPGSAAAESQTVFDGLESPPAVEQREEAGLEIILSSARLNGLHGGAPVTYRGMQVGRVTTVGLSSDAVTIEARVYVEPAYKSLVRANSMFWNQSGFDLQFGLGGLQLDAGTLDNLTQGGVAFATPDDPGEQVTTGHRFDFYEKPEEEWLAWSAQIPVGVTLLPEGVAVPHPYRAVMSWETKSFGLTRSHRRQGWGLPLEGNRLLLLAEMVAVPEDAVDGSAVLELAGEKLPLGELESGELELANTEGKLAIVPWQAGETEVETTERGRLRHPVKIEDTLIISESRQNPLPVATGRLVQDPHSNAWLVDPSISLSPADRGATVVAIGDGAVIGLLDVVDGRGRIYPVP